MMTNEVLQAKLKDLQQSWNLLQVDYQMELFRVDDLLKFKKEISEVLSHVDNKDNLPNEFAVLLNDVEELYLKLIDEKKAHNAFDDDDEPTIETIEELIIMETMSEIDLTEEEMVSESVNDAITILLENMGDMIDKDIEKAIENTIDELKDSSCELDENQIRAFGCIIIENCPLCIEAMGTALRMSRAGYHPSDINNKVRDILGY